MPEAAETLSGWFKGPRATRVVRFWQRVKAPASTDNGAQRWRRIFISMGRSLCSRAVALGCNLLTIPLALHYLGTERYGIWVTLTSSVSMLAFFDFGIGIGLQNKVAEMMGKGQLDQSTQCFRSTLVVLGGISIMLFGVLALVILKTDLSSVLFRGAHFGSIDLKTVLVIIVGAVVLGLPLGLFPRMAFGLQQGWIASVAMASGTAFTLLAVFVASRLGADFTTFVALTVIPPIAAQVVGSFLLARRLPSGLSLLGSFSLREGLGVLRQGSHYVLPQISGVVLTHGPLVLLGTLSSPVNAATYSVFTRISLPFLQLQQMFFEQVWPAITEAVYRGDATWLRNTLRRLLRMNLIYSGFAAAAVVLAVHFLFPMLTRTAGLKPSLLIVFLYAMHVGVMYFLQGFAYIANGLSRMRVQNYFAFIFIDRYLILVAN